jgi:hypothetical protein
VRECVRACVCVCVHVCEGWVSVSVSVGGWAGRRAGGRVVVGGWVGGWLWVGGWVGGRVGGWVGVCASVRVRVHVCVQPETKGLPPRRAGSLERASSQGANSPRRSGGPRPRGPRIRRNKPGTVVQNGRNRSNVGDAFSSLMFEDPHTKPISAHSSPQSARHGDVRINV